MAAPANGLFKTPEELREEYKKRLKGSGGGGANWYTDRVKGGVTLDEDGNVKREGAAWWLQMLEKEGFAETAAQRNEDLKNSQIISDTTALVDREDLKKAAGDTKITAKNVGSIVRTAEKITREKPTPLQQEGIDSSKRAETRAIEAQKDSTAIQRETLALTKQQGQDRLTAQTNQFAHTSEQNALTRRHENERADKRDALSLQMQVMQNDLAEKRMDYDRETARMDKRSAAIAQLMSGLGSLGGAFAL